MRCNRFYIVGEGELFGNGHVSAATGSAAHREHHGIAGVRISPALRRNACDTSREAAKSMEGHAPTQRLRVLAYIQSRGPDGATRDETCKALGLGTSSVNPRWIELAELGWIVRLSKTRPTQSGRKAEVWVAIEHAQAAIGGGV